MPQKGVLSSTPDSRRRAPPSSIVTGALKALPSSSVNARAKALPSSTVNRPRKAPPSSIEDIDRRRRRAGISLGAMLREAQVKRATWRAAYVEPERTRRSTLDRLERALARLMSGDRAVNEGAAVLAYRAVIALAARDLGIDSAKAQTISCDFSAEKPNNPEWAAGARARRLAMYVLCNVLSVGKAGLAKAIGCSRQNVAQAVAAVEAMRDDDPRVDALLTRLAVDFGRDA